MPLHCVLSVNINLEAFKKRQTSIFAFLNFLSIFTRTSLKLFMILEFERQTIISKENNYESSRLLEALCNSWLEFR